LREQEPPAWINHLGSKKGDGFFGGRKPLKRRRQADGLGERAQEWREERKLFDDHGRGAKLWEAKPWSVES